MVSSRTMAQPPYSTIVGVAAHVSPALVARHDLTAAGSHQAALTCASSRVGRQRSATTPQAARRKLLVVVHG
ncbi:hypothetical protein BAUCODRAFT_376564 [Baudoinia panamericana UAMH 10762]|uniref:Uncharacterized protein n=1 Tax=Baudoinia panamericana (strain UAMH 10762) TaxID=717646 RepID=M2LVH8_BAUPA|nr:uncharacterized protein BAUCODRAFT_376564 [Baudoinia panamericana UAMH 10762]EMC98647.1 hypothetical protein BAUCODRAFT_376564 [Baudoinia panamericana UAMH 10762]